MNWAKTITRWDEKHLSFGIWCALYLRSFAVFHTAVPCWRWRFALLVYLQCANGHLMCIGCFSHLLADARLKDETATCPNCRCDISKTSCSRNLAVEKAISELPASCQYCSEQLPRSTLSHHETQLCQERCVKTFLNPQPYLMMAYEARRSLCARTATVQRGRTCLVDLCLLSRRPWS